MYFNFTSVDSDGLIEVSDSSSMMLKIRNFNHVLADIVPKAVGEVIDKGDINRKTKVDNFEIVKEKGNYSLKDIVGAWGSAAILGFPGVITGGLLAEEKNIPIDLHVKVINIRFWLNLDDDKAFELSIKDIKNNISLKGNLEKLKVKFTVWAKLKVGKVWLINHKKIKFELNGADFKSVLKQTLMMTNYM